MKQGRGHTQRLISYVAPNARQTIAVNALVIALIVNILGSHITEQSKLADLWLGKDK